MRLLLTDQYTLEMIHSIDLHIQYEVINNCVIMGEKLVPNVHSVNQVSTITKVTEGEKRHRDDVQLVIRFFPTRNTLL